VFPFTLAWSVNGDSLDNYTSNEPLSADLLLYLCVYGDHF
jgi:hypothetical protein